jgi:hypothetical protein
MDIPRPTPAHERLKKFLGRWTGVESLSPAPWDPEGGTATGTAVNTIALEGFAVIQEYSQSREGKPGLRGHGVIAYDTEAKNYAMHWFSSMGTPPMVYKGDFEGEVLRLSAAFAGGVSRCSWDFGTGGSYTFRLEFSPDGKSWMPMMSGTYARKG